MATTTVDTSMWGLYVHQAKDGSLTVVDSAGKPIAAPPSVKIGADGSFAVVDSSGSAVLDHAKVPLTLSAYSPPTHNVYAYTAADGTVTIVDSAGKPVPTPPDTKKTPNGDLVVVDSSGQVLEDAGGPVEIPPYAPPVANVYVYSAADGTTTVVDAAGTPIASPPLVDTKGVVVGADGKAVVDPTTGNLVTLPAYSPPSVNVYLHTAQDGTTTVVDAAGTPIASPPHVVTSGGQSVLADLSGEALLDASGQPIAIPDYTPPTTGIYLYGEIGKAEWLFVDAAGNPISSPPAIRHWPNEGYVFFGADGEPLLDADGQRIPVPEYVPPTQGIFAKVDTDAATGTRTITILDAAGNPVPTQPWCFVSSAPGVDPPVVTMGNTFEAGKSGNILTDGSGNPITVPLWAPTNSPRLLVHVGGDGSAQVVDGTGQPVASPPTVALHPATGEPAIVDANGQFVRDSNGNLTTLPVYSPPTQGIYAHVLTDPVTGEVDVQIVDGAGNLVQSPPGYKLVSSGDPSDPPTVVLTGADGKPITDTDGIPISPPLYSPPTQGVYAHVLRDPVTGAVDVQIVDSAGNLVQSPPGYKLIPAADPSDPPTVVLTGANGQPLIDTNGNQLTPPTYSPPTQGIYAHVVTNPATGEMDVQLVDAAGNLVPSPPGYMVQKGSDPSDPPTIVLTGTNGKPLTDQDGNPVSVPMDSSSSTPPGTSPPAEEEAAGEDPTDSAADTPVGGETPAEEEGARGGREPIEEAEPISDEERSGTREEMPAETQTEEVIADLDSRTAQVPEIEGKVMPVPEPEAVEFKVETTPFDVEAARIAVEVVAEDESESEERSAEVESDIARVDTSEQVAATPITLPDMPEDLTPVDPISEVGAVGLGAEELVEMVSGRAVPPVGAESTGSDSRGPGESIAEIPDLPVAVESIEVSEIESKIAPVPEPEPVEFRVEAIPADADPVELRVESAVGGVPAEPAVDPAVLEEVEPDSVRAAPMEDESVVGLSVEELVGMATAREETTGEKATPPDMAPLAEEPVIEIPELPVVEVIEVAAALEQEGKITPVAEPESVEFKFFRPEDEIDTSEFRVEVTEAGTLEIDEGAAESLTRYVEEPEEEPIWTSEEEEEEEEEAQP